MTSYLSTNHRLKRRAILNCLLLLLWTKNVNQWSLSTPMMEILFLQSQIAHNLATKWYILLISHRSSHFLFHVGQDTIMRQLRRRHTRFSSQLQYIQQARSINVDELVGMSKLSLGESIGNSSPSSLSLKLLEGSSRQSAFHANPASGSSNINSSGSPIHAV